MDYYRSSEVIEQAEKEVKSHLAKCYQETYPDFLFTEGQIKKYIKRIKGGSGCGIDRISPEHLKFGLNTSLPKLLSHLLTICVRVGVVPECFTQGLLVPVLKKPNSEPTCPSNYRPITLSVIISNYWSTVSLMIVHLISLVYHSGTLSQYGCVANRGCSMATTLAHDIGAYANAMGSTLFYCSLDAEGAFDFLPHCVILQKSINIISDKYWRLLVKWYSAMCAYIHWNSCLGSKINIKRGTRQGGLISAFMFNLFIKI